jgi:hypothetical protein
MESYIALLIPSWLAFQRCRRRLLNKSFRKYDTLNSGSLPEKSLRNMGLSHAIADSWPFDSKLAEEIAKAERAFIEAK